MDRVAWWGWERERAKGEEMQTQGTWFEGWKVIAHTHTKSKNKSFKCSFKLLLRYFSSRNRFIWGQQRIEIQGLQPWCEPNARTAGERELLDRGKRNLQTAGNRVLASHWLRPCREEDASFSSCWALPSAQGSLFWARSSNWGFSSFICRPWCKISDPFPRPICR